SLFLSKRWFYSVLSVYIDKSSYLRGFRGVLEVEFLEDLNIISGFGKLSSKFFKFRILKWKFDEIGNVSYLIFCKFWFVHSRFLCCYILLGYEIFSMGDSLAFLKEFDCF